MNKIKEGDLVTVKGNSYGFFKVHKLLPKGSHNRACMLAEVLHSNSDDFNFGIVKVFRVVDLRWSADK